MGPPIRRIESHLEGARGHALFRRAWLPQTPERALLLVHGYAEHTGRYEHVGAWLAERGCAVHAFDQQGHGRSEGVRGHIRRFSDFLDDVDVLLEAVRAQHPDVPLFLVGHSMGGLIAAAHARERQPDVAGVVTSGAALALGQGVSRGRRLMARLLRRVAPKLSLPSGIDAQGLSRDPAVVETYLADPLVYDTMTASLAWELLSAVERTGRGGADVKASMLLLHGGDDPICPVDGSRAFFDALQAPGKALHVYPGLFHEIFNEPEQEQVFEDLLRWTRERAA